MGNKCCHEFGALLTDIDLLGVPVTLTYEGKKTYKTCLGGVCSLMTLILIIFVIAGIITILIAWLTMSWQSIKAATANPVDSLRNE